MCIGDEELKMSKEVTSVGKKQMKKQQPKKAKKKVKKAQEEKTEDTE